MSLQKISKILFPVLVVIFIALYVTDEPLYRKFTKEDQVVEWLTFLLLILSGALSASLANEIRDKYKYFHWFFWAFAAFCILAGCEEISWGQRVMGVESTEFFKKHSDKQEINLHNIFQGTVGIKTKDIALLVLLIYGVIMPLLEKKKYSRIKWMQEHYLIIPPVFLIPAFLIAAVFMFNFPTGYEEEIGEFLFSICFLLMVLWNYNLFNNSNAFENVREPVNND